MLYITKQKEAYYYIAQPVAEVFIDLYNFSSMHRTDEAVKSIIKWNINLFGLAEEKPESSERYELVLDFLANMGTPNINAVIGRINEYFIQNGFTSVISENPLTLTVSNLKLKEILTFIQDKDFQSINNAVASLNCSTWRVVKI